MKTAKLIKKSTAFALVLALAVSLCACSRAADGPAPSDTAAPALTDGGSIGDGDTAFSLEIVHASGESKTLTVCTDAETVGAALLALGVIAGEDSSYGLYVKTVDGETLDYDTDGKYWAFYVDGVYAAVGVDQTAAEDGVSYAFCAE